jgi:hypothetical protein
MVLAVPAKRAVHTIGNGNRSRHGTSDFDGKLGDGQMDAILNAPQKRALVATI